MRGEPILGELQGRAIDGDRIGKKLGLIIEAAQVDVVARELGVQFELRVCERVGACFGGRVRRRHDIAHPSPDVDLVGRLRADEIVSVVGRLVERPKRAIGRLLVGQKVRDRVDLRVGGAQRGVRARDSLVVGRDGGGESWIGRVHLRLQFVERSILESEPPLPVAGRVPPPAVSSLNLDGTATEGGA